MYISPKYSLLPRLLKVMERRALSPQYTRSQTDSPPPQAAAAQVAPFFQFAPRQLDLNVFSDPRTGTGSPSRRFGSYTELIQPCTLTFRLRTSKIKVLILSFSEVSQPLAKCTDEINYLKKNETTILLESSNKVQVSWFICHQSRLLR